MIAELLRRFGEHHARQDRRQRRQRVFAGARRLERIAALLDLALDVAGLAGDRRGVFEPVVIGLELVVGDAPVLDRHVVGDEFLAVALLVHGADLELHVGPAPGVAAPVRARAAHALARQERPQPPHRQRFLRDVVADRQRVARGVLHQPVTHHVAQLVADVGHREILVGGIQAAAFECDHLHPGFGQFLRQDTAGPAEPDDDDIDFLELRCHVMLLSSGPRCRGCRRCISCRDTSRRSRDAPRPRRGSRSASSRPCRGCRRRSGRRTCPA